jgi:hypothetical protein
MARGYFVNNGKNSYYWKLLSYLPGDLVYEKGVDVVPYTPDEQQVYSNYIPGLPVGTQLKVWINGHLQTQTFISQPDGTFYAPLRPLYGPFQIEVTDLSGSITYFTDWFQGLNFPLYFNVLAPFLQDLDIELWRMAGDLDPVNVRDSKLQGHYAWYFGFPLLSDWSSTEYRETILGNGNCKPGFLESYLFGSTNKGMVDTIKSIIGCQAVSILSFSYLREMGWIIDDSGLAAFRFVLCDQITFPTAPVLPAVLYDVQWLQSSVQISISGADRLVTNEGVVKNSPTPNTDKLGNETLTAAPVTITQGMSTWVEGVDFSVDRVAGTITWITAGPATLSTYYVTYTYIPKAAIEMMARKVAPYWMNLYFVYL